MAISIQVDEFAIDTIQDVESSVSSSGTFWLSIYLSHQISNSTVNFSFHYTLSVSESPSPSSNDESFLSNLQLTVTDVSWDVFAESSPDLAKSIQKSASFSQSRLFPLTVKLVANSFQKQNASDSSYVIKSPTMQVDISTVLKVIDEALQHSLPSLSSEELTDSLTQSQYPSPPVYFIAFPITHEIPYASAGSFLEPSQVDKKKGFQQQQQSISSVQTPVVALPTLFTELEEQSKLFTTVQPTTVDDVYRTLRRKGHDNTALGISPHGQLFVSGDDRGLLVVGQIGNPTNINTSNISTTTTTTTKESIEKATKSFTKIPPEILNDRKKHIQTLRRLLHNPKVSKTTAIDNNINNNNNNNNEIIKPIPGHFAEITCTKFFPSGTVVLSSGRDFQLKLWNIEDGTNPRSFAGHTKAITDFDFVIRRELISTTDGDGKNEEQQEEEEEIKGTGRNFVSCGGEDGTIRLWETGAQKLVHTFVLKDLYKEFFSSSNNNNDHDDGHDFVADKVVVFELDKMYEKLQQQQQEPQQEEEQDKKDCLQKLEILKTKLSDEYKQLETGTATSKERRQYDYETMGMGILVFAHKQDFSGNAITNKNFICFCVDLYTRKCLFIKDFSSSTSSSSSLSSDSTCHDDPVVGYVTSIDTQQNSSSSSSSNTYRRQPIIVLGTSQGYFLSFDFVEFLKTGILINQDQSQEKEEKKKNDNNDKIIQLSPNNEPITCISIKNGKLIAASSSTCVSFDLNDNNNRFTFLVGFDAIPPTCIQQLPKNQGFLISGKQALLQQFNLL